MATTKVAVTVDRDLLRELDSLVEAGEFPNRSRAVNAALVCLQEKRQRRSRLLAELANLDVAEERALADEALVSDVGWPAF
jgi:Arc/MetJ-type ribon-helix-helix transcriptional regulator